MPWNDTAQLDFLNPKTRDGVSADQARRDELPDHPLRCGDDVGEEAHSTALVSPPGRGGDIAGRVPHSLDDETFHRRSPMSFGGRSSTGSMRNCLTPPACRSVLMMEGYFVRTLGMHRCTTAFMNMLKNQENKNTGIRSKTPHL